MGSILKGLGLTIWGLIAFGLFGDIHLCWLRSCAKASRFKRSYSR